LRSILGSRKASEAADFARHRWAAAKILLLEGQCAVIDDWLYDERVGLEFSPVAICDAAKRLLVKEEVVPTQQTGIVRPRSGT
jgi:hypothetical protein